MRVRTICANGAPLALREWGEDEGEPLLFWHSLGIGKSGSSLASIAPVLAGECGLHVIAVDAPGFGLSPPRPPSAYRFAELVALQHCVLDEVGADAAILMGQSWGGAISCRAVAMAPRRVRALVLLDSGHIDYADLSFVDPEATWEELRHRAARRATVTSTPSPETEASVVFHSARDTTSATRSTIAASRIPVLLLLATEPAEWRAESEQRAARFKTGIPEARLERLPGCGHDVLADGGPALGRLIGDWLRGAGLVE